MPISPAPAGQRPAFTRMASRLRAPLLLLLLTVGFYWKLTLTNQYTWLSSPDAANQLMPWYQFQAGEWHQGRVPLWNPYEWAGQSLIGQAQPGVVDPLNLLMYWAPLKKGWIRQETYHGFYVLGHFLAALTFYGLCRSLSCSRIASVAAGCGYSFAGIPGSTDWPQMFHAAIWGPAALMFQFRALQGLAPLRNAILSGAFLGLAWLSGHHQIPVYFTYTVAGLWVFSLVREYRASGPGVPIRRLTAAAALCGAMMIATGAAQILPSFEYGRRSIRWVGAPEAVRWDQRVPYSVHGIFSAKPASVIGLAVPTDVHYQPYVGVTLCFLAALGIASAWQRAHTRWLAAIGAAGLVVSLGALTPLHGVLYSIVPMIEKARVPAMAMVLLDVAICALAALAIDRFRDSAWTARFGTAIGIFAGCGAAAGVLLFGHKFVPENAEAGWVPCLISAAALWALTRSAPDWATPAATGAALTGLILFDAGLVTGRNWPNRLDPEHTSFVKPLAGNKDLAAFFRSRPEAPRIEYDDKALKYNFGSWWGIESMTAYTASAPLSLFRHDAFSGRTRNLLGIRYLVANEPRDEFVHDVYTAESGLKVFENPDAFGRLLFLHDIKKAEDDKHASALMQTKSIDLRRTGFVIGDPPPVETCESGDGPMEFTRRVPGHMKINVEAGCRGMLVVTDLFDPGWEATLDGKPAEVWEADAMVLGVVVEKGKHVVELRYRPAPVRYGLMLTGLGALAALTAAWRKNAPPNLA